MEPVLAVTQDMPLVEIIALSAPLRAMLTAKDSKEVHVLNALMATILDLMANADKPIPFVKAMIGLMELALNAITDTKSKLETVLSLSLGIKIVKNLIQVAQIIASNAIQDI